MLGFQNKAPNTKLLQFYENQGNEAYLEKCDFQRMLICQIWGHHWICGIETSPKVISTLNFESRLALYKKQDKD